MYIGGDSITQNEHLMYYNCYAYNPVEPEVMKPIHETSIGTTSSSLSIKSITLPTDETNQINAIFKISDGKCYINGQVMDLVAPPFIQDGKAMLPISQVAEALNVKPQDIKYKNGIITLNIEDKIIQFKTGSNLMIVNGIQQPMDTQTVSKNGRAYIPVSHILELLDISSHYDVSTKTLTFNNIIN